MIKRRRLVVVAAVIERGDEVLVSLRHPKGDRPSQWEFPGGKVERGESEPIALERELKEAQARAAAAEKRLAESTRPVSGPVPGTLPGSALPVPAAGNNAPTVH